MTKSIDKFAKYFLHLKKISFIGKCYKKYFSSPILFLSARYFGINIVEVGAGIGSGVLGAFPSRVCGLDINAKAVEYCKSKGLKVELIEQNGTFPILTEGVDACILDNVLEHIEDPLVTLNECYRITKEKGGLVVAVPGQLGFQSDEDHKKFYGVEELKALDDRWKLVRLFSTPFFVTNDKLSSSVKQYCLVAIYKKQ
jgi:SAM-dependent methyltransferase